MDYPTAAESAQGTSTDAAFGSAGLGAAQMSPASVTAAVTEMQTLLNMRGYGPLQVTGTIDDATKRAMYNVAPGEFGTNPPREPSIQRIIELLKAPTLQPGPALTPWFKQPKYLMGGLAVLGVVGYIAYRTGALDGVLGEWDEEPEEDEGAGRKVSKVPSAGSTRHKRPPKAKCAVVPDVDDGVELLPPPGAAEAA